jgi:hypothetical protein
LTLLRISLLTLLRIPLLTLLRIPLRLLISCIYSSSPRWSLLTNVHLSHLLRKGRILSWRSLAGWRPIRNGIVSNSICRHRTRSRRSKIRSIWIIGLHHFQNTIPLNLVTRCNAKQNSDIRSESRETKSDNCFLSYRIEICWSNKFIVFSQCRAQF